MRLKGVAAIAAVVLLAGVMAAMVITPAAGHDNGRVGHLFRHVKNKLGYQTVTSLHTVAANANEFGSATCPQGKSPVGGGVDAVQPNNAHDTLLRIVESYPSGSSWQALVASSRTEGSSTFTVYAICANV